MALNVGLVRYPATVAPETGSIVIEAICADNAHSISLNMLVKCRYDGFWIISNLIQPPITPRCQCNEGYHEASVDGRMICEGENVAIFLCFFATQYSTPMHS